VRGAGEVTSLTDRNPAPVAPQRTLLREFPKLFFWIDWPMRREFRGGGGMAEWRERVSK
jgi:hypothetical protein